MYHFHPAILAVSRQINHEAGQTLRENLFVKLKTKTWYRVEDLKLEGLPIVAEDDSASRVTYSASELTLIWGTETCDSFPFVHMFAADDMTTFCRILNRFDLSGGSLSIAITGIAITGIAPTTTTILKLLEPFRRLHSMASVRISGQINSEYRLDLIKQMSKQPPDMDVFMQEIDSAMEEGDQATNIHDFSTAISRFTRAREDIHDHHCTFKQWEAILEKGRFRGQTSRTAFLQIQQALNIKLANTYLRLKNHTRAHQWISLALAHFNHYGQLHGAPPGGAEGARIYAIAAQASEGLRIVGRAIDEMKEAVRHDPGDSNLTTEFVRLERKMQGGDEDLKVL